MRAVLKKHMPASNKNVRAGNSEKIRFEVGPLNRLGKGRNHPPSHSVTAMDETAIIAEYSARKNKDHRKPLYSVWNPAVSSDSASGKSQGARFVSATMAMAKIPNAISPSGQNLNRNHIPCDCCALTISIMLRVPMPSSFMLVIMIAEMTARPIATSYDTICALERSAPIRG